jgi:acyl dehydratase
MSLLTPEMRARLGETRSYTAPEAIGAAAFRYFGTAIGDLNPLYSDDSFARQNGLAGVTAPPTLITESNQYTGLPIDADGFVGHSWGLSIAGARQVRGGNSYTFERRVRPDDRLTVTWVIDDFTEKTTRSGSAMLVVASSATYTNQHGELLAVNAETLIFVEKEVAA